MQELIFKNYLKVFVIMVIGAGFTAAAALSELNPIEIPIPVYIFGLLAVFLIMSFVFYPMATLGQTFQISITGILANKILLAAAYFINEYTELPQFLIKPDFILVINPLTIAISFLFGLLILCILIGFEKPAIKEEKILTQKDLQESVNPEQYENESIKLKPLEEESPQVSEEKAPATYEELYQVKTPETKPQEKEFLEDFLENNIQDLPEARLNEDYLDNTEEITGTKADFIPTNIRLSEKVAPKETDSKGKIGAIGKLLVSDRDIENIIETNESKTENALNSKINVITTISGEKMYEKFNAVKQEFSSLKEFILLNSGGFTIANDFEDKQKAQITGALVAGIYHTLQNYIAQISLPSPVRIFFESAENHSYIAKTSDEILFSNWDKEFAHIDYGDLLQMLNSEDLTSIDITPYTDIMGIEKFTVSDSEGNLINSNDKNGDSQEFVAVTSAIFDNIKVFLMNIQLVKLSKIVVFTSQKVLTIIKSDDKLISILTDGSTLPKITDDILKIEEM